jgi:hypothetical protein
MAEVDLSGISVDDFSMPAHNGDDDNDGSSGGDNSHALIEFVVHGVLLSSVAIAGRIFFAAAETFPALE